jgi:hypothetical protein
MTESLARRAPALTKCWECHQGLRWRCQAGACCKSWKGTSVLPPSFCWVEYLAGNFDQAIELTAQARASGDCGSVSGAIEALSLVHAGESTPHLEGPNESARKSGQSLLLQGAWGYACAIGGQTAQAAHFVQRLKGTRGAAAYPIALVLVGLDECVEAIALLEKTSSAENSLRSLGYGSDPTLQPLRRWRASSLCCGKWGARPEQANRLAQQSGPMSRLALRRSPGRMKLLGDGGLAGKRAR